MEQLTTVPNDLATTEPAVFSTAEQSSIPASLNWRRRVWQARAGALLGSFPSRLFLLTLAGYLIITSLSLWLTGALPAQSGAAGILDLSAWAKASAASWARFDSYFFLHIAHYGYTDQGLGAFFPLYPLLIRLFAWPLAGHFTLAALLVSWLCAWGCALWFYRLAQREYGERVARWALLFLLLCPVSFFSVAPYSESLFLLLSIGAVERARAGRLWQASLLAALGMLTRPTGILLLIPLAWEWGRRAYASDAFKGILRMPDKTRVLPGAGCTAMRPRWPGWGKPLALSGMLRRDASQTGRFSWLSLWLIPLALAGYMLYLKLQTGNALAFLKGESSAWHRHLALPWETAGLFGMAFQHAWQAGEYTVFIGNVVDLLLVLPLPALVLYCAIRRRQLWLGAALYQMALTLLLIAVPNVPGPYGEEVLLSTQRFMLPAFPIFLLLGRLGANHPRLARLLLVASAALLLLNTWRFLNGVFIA